MALTPALRKHNENVKKKESSKTYNSAITHSQQLHRNERLVISKFAPKHTTGERTYYGCIDRKDSPTLLVEYQTNLPHIAQIYFEEVARLNKGRLGVFSSY